MSQQAVVPNAVEAGAVTGAVRTRQALGPAARRRRVLLALGMTGVVLALSARLARPLLWVSVGDGVVTLGYLALVARARHLAVQHEMAVAFAAPDGGFDWGAFERLGATPVTYEERVVIAGSAGGAGRYNWCRFAAAYLLGWALTPIAIVIRLLGGDRRDLEGGGVLARLVALQRHGRAHSMRALAMSVATTAGVSAVGAAGLAAASAPTASAAPAPGIYTVRSGDTLAGIAAAHGTTVAALAAANHLLDADVIYAGQQLVPGATSSPAGATSGAFSPAGATRGASESGTYTVRAGDTLGSIAARYATSVTALAEVNGIADPNMIDVGQILEVSGSAGSGAPAAPAPTGAATAAGARASSGGSYTVRAGDTLDSIATRYATTTSALVAANHLANPDIILVGQVLSLGAEPAAAAPAPAATAPAAPASAAPAVALVATAPHGASAVAVALAQVGKPYQWAGAGPSSFDCSGLVMYAYEAVGVALPHYTVTQYQDTARIAEADLQPGDLVFYGGAAPSHVAMYIGSGQIVTADTTGTPVRVESITWDGTPSGFGRVG